MEDKGRLIPVKILTKFWRRKSLLFIALTCEIIAFLMERNILCENPVWIERFSYAGVAITALYLAISYFSAQFSKYKRQNIASCSQDDKQSPGASYD